MKIPDALRSQVIHLFEQMDRAYNAVAQPSGFICSGCKDNCCLTRFYHHTLLEYLYLKIGLAALDTEVSSQVQVRAASGVKQVAEMDQFSDPVRVMCPLNQDSRCILYAHRPMICRLHGIPHTLRRPDGRLQAGPGCDEFLAQCGASKEKLDRTPFYIAMAKLERQLRAALGVHGKIKMTIAQIIVDEGLMLGSM